MKKAVKKDSKKDAKKAIYNPTKKKTLKGARVYCKVIRSGKLSITCYIRKVIKGKHEYFKYSGKTVYDSKTSKKKVSKKKGNKKKQKGGLFGKPKMNSKCEKYVGPKRDIGRIKLLVDHGKECSVTDEEWYRLYKAYVAQCPNWSERKHIENRRASNQVTRKIKMDPMYVEGLSSNDGRTQKIKFSELPKDRHYNANVVPTYSIKPYRQAKKDAAEEAEKAVKTEQTKQKALAEIDTMMAELQGKRNVNPQTIGPPPPITKYTEYVDNFGESEMESIWSVGPEYEQ